MTIRKMTFAKQGLVMASALILAVSASADLVYISGNSATAVPGVGSVQDEDIVVLDTDTGLWSMYFDGSDVGLSGNADIDAISILENGNVLLSLESPGSVGGISVTSSDIVEFIPVSLGSNTAGTFSMFFDGSDVGVGPKKENVDAIGFAPDGRLLVSLDSNFQVTGLEGRDEDLIVFTGTLGSSTSGSFALYLDGSEVAFNNPNEDIQGVSVDPESEDIYVTFKGKYNIGGVKGDGLDILICETMDAAPVANCNSPLPVYVDGSALALDARSIDGISIIHVDVEDP